MTQDTAMNLGDSITSSVAMGGVSDEFTADDGNNNGRRSSSKVQFQNDNQQEQPQTPAISFFNTKTSQELHPGSDESTNTEEHHGAVVTVRSSGIEDDDDDDEEDDRLDDSSEGTSQYRTQNSISDSSTVNAPGSMGRRAAPTLAHKETQAVNRSKICVYMVLLIAAISVGITTFAILRQDELEAYDNQFDDFASEVLDFAETNAKIFLGNLLTISNTLTSFANHEASKYGEGGAQLWPNITLPNFDIRTTDSFEQLAGPELFLFSPIVPAAQRDSFVEYAQENQGWIKEDLELRGQGSVDPGLIPDQIYSYTRDDTDMNPAFSVPIWQLGPVPTNAKIVLMDLYTQPSFARMIDDVTEVRHILLSEVVGREFLAENIDALDTSQSRDINPRSYAAQPVFSSFEGSGEVTRELVGFVFAVIPWDSYFLNTLAPGTNGILVQIKDTCGSSFGYQLNGPEVEYLGENYEPPSQFRGKAKGRPFAEFARYDGDDESEYIQHCEYEIVVYPSTTFLNDYKTSKPVWLTVIIVLVFFFTAIVFIMYDFFVQRRQNKVLTTAQRTTAIVSSLFPKNIQKRILDDASETHRKNASNAKNFRRATFTAKHHLKTFLGEDTGNSLGDGLAPTELDNGDYLFQSKPIADFFPETTIMFGDIVGFTAWSSTREPSQVFTLLETIYHEFDQVAKQRRVFKVETVGDCYVAVAGLPDPRKDHALVMARFARDCFSQMRLLTKRLEVVLGPDTADLSMRIGLHSGPVTAGVLRGERARFQLFGDTMNTASRMESTGSPSKIQVSPEMADQLILAGKGHWIKPRVDKVLVKGKGHMQTYWLETKGESSGASVPGGSVSKNKVTLTDSETHSSEEGIPPQMTMQDEHPDHVDEPSVINMGNHKLSDRLERLVNWNVDLLSRLLQEVVARRETKRTVADPEPRMSSLEKDFLHRSDNSLAEVREIIKLPAYRPEFKLANPAAVVLPSAVVDQLRHFITMLALMYHDNPFHNFEHASHVTMSVVKLFSRIVAPDLDHVADMELARSLHDHTYGITSDPLTQFAVILSALIHDADHPGVPNTQLIKEGSAMADVYADKSIAEQNSVDLAWALLMKHQYKDLRRALYITDREFRRFRQLVVNTVLATDIMDKSLKQLRNNRWDRAFAEIKAIEDSPRDEINRKATIVIEHLIQASDVAHTMQHWHIYRKWNARLFDEMYKAFLAGRADTDPSENWYKGELGFFDFYIIPLAKKLKDCGVFGVSSDEYLQYALNNRNEWERKGEEVVRGYLSKFENNTG